MEIVGGRRARTTPLVSPVLHIRDIDVRVLLDSRANTARRVSMKDSSKNKSDSYKKKTCSQLSLSAHLSKYRTFKNRENEQGKASDTQSRTMYLLWQKRYLLIFHIFIIFQPFQCYLNIYLYFGIRLLK